MCLSLIAGEILGAYVPFPDEVFGLMWLWKGLGFLGDFLEVVEGDGLLVEADGVLDGVVELRGDYLLGELVAHFGLFELLLGVAGDDFFVDTGHTILSELAGSEELGHVEDFVGFNLDLEFLEEVGLDDFVLDGVFLSGESLIGVLSLGEEELLDGLCGESHRAVFFHHGLVELVAEEDVAVLRKLVLDEFLDGSAVFFFVVYLVLAEYHLVVFLTEFSGNADDDFRDCHLEVALDVGCDSLVDMEHRSELACVACGCFPGVEDNLVAGLLACELGGLFLVLEVEGEDDAVGHLDGAFSLAYVAVLVELHDGTLDNAVLSHFLTGLLLAEALAHVLVLLVDHLVGHVNLIEGIVVLLAEVDVELGNEGEVIFEFLVTFLEGFLDFNGHGVAHDGKIVFSDVVNDGAVYGVVDDIACHLLAETALEFAEGDVALAESGDDVGAAELLEFFGYFILIVIFFDRHGETNVHG